MSLQDNRIDEFFMSLQEIEEVVFSDNKQLDISDYQTIRNMPDDSSNIIDIYTLMKIYIK